MSSNGKLFVIAAPSGAGKTSLVNALVASDRRLVISVSHTTRPPRPGEVDGVHYHFTSCEEFARMAGAGEFLESAVVYGQRYGTHAGKTRELLASGKDVILEIDWQGARQVRAAFSGCHTIFILPPSLEALRTRLGRRGQDSEAVIAARMNKAREEISHCGEFEHVVVNDDFEVALGELAAIVESCREGRRLASETHAELLAQLLQNR